MGGGGLEKAGKECLDRERWMLFFHGHLLGESKMAEKIDR